MKLDLKDACFNIPVDVRSQISSFQVGRPNTSVPMAPIWSFYCPMVFYKSTAASTGVVKGAWCENDLDNIRTLGQEDV